MRRISADYILPVSGQPLKNGIVEIDDHGKILSLIDTQGILNETSKLEYYNGIIIPGLILPCVRIEHFIYSALKGFAHGASGTFVTDTDADDWFKDLDIKLHRSGIRGTGCITSRFHFFRNQSEGLVNYHSFIEIPGTDKSDPYELFNRAVSDKTTAWNEYGLSSSIIPSDCCSEEIMEYIIGFATVHENPLILGCRGTSPDSILESFTRILARVTGRQKDQALAGFRNPIIIIAGDLSGLPEELDDKTFLLIPLDKTYAIDPRFSDKDRWARLSGNIVFSRNDIDFNPDVPVVSEIKSLQANNPWLSFQDLIRCFTLNPARALLTDNLSGSLSPGTVPGLNLVTDFNYDDFKLKDTSVIRAVF
jgi:hypothetical protein